MEVGLLPGLSDGVLDDGHLRAVVARVMWRGTGRPLLQDLRADRQFGLGA